MSERRYCHRCGSAVDADAATVCGACGAPLPACAADDPTRPAHTLELDRTVSADAAGPGVAPDGVTDQELERLRRSLGTRFDVEAEIGAGGMGRVYRAVDRALGRTMAIKSVSPEWAANREWLERLQREVAYAVSTLAPVDTTSPAVGSTDGLDAAVRRLESFNPEIRDVYLVVPGAEPAEPFRVSAAWHEGESGDAAAATRGHDTWGGGPIVRNDEALAHMRDAMSGQVVIQRELDTDIRVGTEWDKRLLGYTAIHTANGPGAVLVIEITSDAVASAFAQIEHAFNITLALAGAIAIALAVAVAAGLTLAWRTRG